MRCIVLFAKAPVPGTVKTRLTPSVSAEEAAMLQDAFIMDTLGMMKAFSPMDIYVACHPSSAHPCYDEAKRRFPVNLIDQGEGSLGDRLDRVARQLKSSGYHTIVVIGSDSPTLPVRRIEEAFSMLEKRPLVLGPSLDGGYYLIGFSGPVPKLFDGISWGSDQVFAETVERAGREAIPLSILPFWYDVDTVRELRFLKIHLDALDDDCCPETRKVMETVEGRPGFSGMKGVSSE